MKTIMNVFTKIHMAHARRQEKRQRVAAVVDKIVTETLEGVITWSGDTEASGLIFGVKDGQRVRIWLPSPLLTIIVPGGKETHRVKIKLSPPPSASIVVGAGGEETHRVKIKLSHGQKDRIVDAVNAARNGQTQSQIAIDAFLAS